MSAENNFAPPPGALTSDEPFVPARGRALVVYVLFAAYILVTLFRVAASVAELTTPPVLLGGPGEQVTLTGLLRGLVYLAAFFVYVPLVVAFLVWLHRVSKNVPALGNPRSGVEYTPGWAVGSFFIPFGNLYMPYKGVREVWDKSDPAIRTADDMAFTPAAPAPLVVGWWVAWLASTVVSNIFFRLLGDAKMPADGRFIAGFELVSGALNLAAAVLAVLVVRGVERRQSERARHVFHVAQVPPPPPVFHQPPPALPS